MRPFKDLPLASKALALGVVPTLCAVLLVTVTSIVTTYFRARTNTLTDLEGQAAIVAENIGAAIRFQDHESAAATLHALKERRNVDRVCVFDETGRLFENYSNDGSLCAATKDAFAGATLWTMAVERPVIVAGKPAGSVRIVGSLVLFYAWIRSQILAILGSFVVATLIALALARRLQPSISGPVLSLAKTADAVSATRDYGIRAVRTTGDEVGGLVDSFNSMLEEIQRRNDALIVEIAERRRAEESKDVFLAAVSHELRTPLNAIIGWLQILRDTKPGPEITARALESLERNARSQARLIEDLLDVSRMSGSAFRLNVGEVDLRQVVAAAVDIVTPAASAKPLDLRLITPATPCVVRGDSDRLQQLVLNILSNAVKFTPGEGAVEVTLQPPDHGDRYGIVVKDTGAGIPPEFLPNVFEPFRQADGSTTRQHRGLGLGLAIARQITAQHGGTIAAASDGPGRGTTVTVLLPRTEAPEGAAVGQTPAAAAARRPSLQGRRVLVVDDDPDGLDIAAAALAMGDADVTRASSGPEAIASWQAGSFDLLVCDIAMPGMDGFDVLRRLTADGQPPPAIAITAHASIQDRDRILAAGFRNHIAKPYNTADLLRRAADLLGILERATA
jgi:signal transduction histidine kinase/CheY-like chemotaxis protein